MSDLTVGDMTVSDLAMRPGQAGDLADVVALTEAAYRPWTESFDAPPIPVTEDYAPRIAAGEVFLMDSGGKARGLVVIETHADHLMIFSLVVAPDFQGHGAGRFLLSFVESCARAAGLGEVRLYTNARMERNIALYEHCGYGETARRENPLRPGWIAVHMTKRLD